MFYMLRKNFIVRTKVNCLLIKCLLIDCLGGWFRGFESFLGFIGGVRESSTGYVVL